ncbi:MAG TPA: nitrilase-related carbon-nitrogen hydrolase, partial [Bacteroidia bacterium]
MKIALAQINVIIGDFEGNSSTIIKKIEEAKLNGIDLIVFPELSVCGYPPQDFLEFDDFIQKSYLAVESIAKHCNGIAAIVGSPTKNPNIEGKNLYNSACFLTDGKVQAYAHKALLPNYDIFDEYRYFEPSKSFSCITFKGKKIALTICEDIWDIDDDPLYTLSPMKELLRENPD